MTTCTPAELAEFEAYLRGLKLEHVDFGHKQPATIRRPAQPRYRPQFIDGKGNWSDPSDLTTADGRQAWVELLRLWLRPARDDDFNPYWIARQNPHTEGTGKTIAAAITAAVNAACRKWHDERESA